MFVNIAMQLKDPFYKLTALGLGTIYGFQVFLTIGGGSRFIPLTGVTLPLISMGGSSLSATILMFSILHGIYIKEFTDYDLEEAEDEDDTDEDENLSEEDDTDTAVEETLNEDSGVETVTEEKFDGHFLKERYEDEEFQGNFRKNL